MTESTCLSEERHAKISASPEKEKDLKDLEEALHMHMSIWFDVSCQDGLFGKTFRGCCQEIADEDSFAYCNPCPTAGMLVRGACWTLNMSEWTASPERSRKDEGVCSLSAILEPMCSRLEGYCLSEKACAGILRRAEKREKKLPAELAAEECPDSLRYRALGNSMAVNCMRWIGRRIESEEMKWK